MPSIFKPSSDKFSLFFLLLFKKKRPRETDLCLMPKSWMNVYDKCDKGPPVGLWRANRCILLLLLPFLFQPPSNSAHKKEPHIVKDIEGNTLKSFYNLVPRLQMEKILGVNLEWTLTPTFCSIIRVPVIYCTWGNIHRINNFYLTGNVFFLLFHLAWR